VIDWDRDLERLVAETRRALTRFAGEFPDASVCAVFFDADPLYGYVIIALDTAANSLRSCRELEQWAVEGRQRMLPGPDAWRNAKYFLTSPAVSLVQTNSGDFEHSQYAEIQFPDWRRLNESGNVPEGAENEDHWLAGHVRLLLWRAAERLIATGAFDVLNPAAPCVVGYGLHDEEEAILRVLRWPDSVRTGDAPRGEA
jgi:hypothetical protein